MSPRPAGIPESAHYVAANGDGYRWVDGAVDDAGKHQGPAKIYADTGYLHGETSYVDDHPDGEFRVYHPDGALASVGHWRDGKLFDAVHHRGPADSPEAFPKLPARIVAVRYCSSDSLANQRIAYFDADGVELSDAGEPMPARPAGVDPLASWYKRQDRWIAGAVLRGAGKPTGALKHWTGEGVLLRHDEYDAAGAPQLRQEFFADGSLKKREIFVDGKRHEYDQWRAPGVWRSRERCDAEGRDLYKADYAKDGSLDDESDWEYDGERLVRHAQRDKGTIPLFEVARDGDRLHCKLYDDGALLAEGDVEEITEHDDDDDVSTSWELIGRWQVFDASPRLTVDVTPANARAKDIERRAVYYALQRALFEVIEPTLPPVPALADAAKIDWAQIQTCYGTGKPFLRWLRALTSEEPIVRDHGIGQIGSHIEHQGSVYPSTAAVVPFLIALLDHPAADALAIAQQLLGVAQAASEVRAEAEEDWQASPAPQDDDWRLPILGTLDAIGAHWDRLAAQLETGAPAVKAVIVALAGHARGRDLSTEVRALARSASDPVVRAIAVDALCAPDAKIERADVAPCLDDGDALVRLAAAVAIASRFSKNAPARVDEVLAAAVASLPEIGPRYRALPFVNAHPAVYLALAASHRRTPRCFALAPALAAQLEEVDAISASELGRGLLALALGTGKQAPMPHFVDVIDALARSERFFAFNVNAAEVLRSFALPTTASELAAWAAQIDGAKMPADALRSLRKQADAADDADDEDA